MRFPRRSGAAVPPTGGRPDRERRRRIGRGAAAAICALAVTMLTATDAMAKVTTVTAVTTTNPGQMKAVGPVNTVNGFPAWYQDSTGRKIEPCLDQDNKYCGLIAGTVPAPGPIVFPTNFPPEWFYQAVGSTLTFPGGGSAVLTLGLEGGFTTPTATAGNQQTFARTRIVVKNAPASTTLTFAYPFGTATITTDATGAGKLVEDLTPAVGNFSTALSSNFGPFLVWDTGTIKDSTGEYVGDPAVPHKVTGAVAPFTNAFSVSGPVTASTDQFTIQGKVSTNTGVHADAASVTADGKFVDVFATSGGEQLQVEATGSTPKTPMLHDPASDRFYARLPVTGTAPTTVTVTNIADSPVSTSGVAVATPTGLSITKAEFDGAKLTVNATSTTPTDVLTVTGYGDLANGTASFTTVSPPATVEVKTGARSATAAVVITGGTATTAQPPVTPTQPPGGGTGTPTAPVAPANLTATPGSTSVDLSWGAVTGATKYQVTTYTVDATGKATKAATQPVAVTGTPLPTTQSIVGLTTNTAYQFTVTATTAAGTSVESAPVNATTTAETLTITTAKWKSTDFRVVGTSTATNGSVSVYGVNPASAGATPLAGMAGVPLTSAVPPATGSAFDARVRTGVPPRPNQVWVRSSSGAVTGPFPVS